MPWGDNPSPPPVLLAEPSNGGIGFQAWVSSETGGSSSGFFSGLPYGGNGSGGNVNPINGLQSANSFSFGQYGQGLNNFSRSFRSLRSPLMVGGDIVVRIGGNYRNGAKGVYFNTTSDNPNQNKFGIQFASNRIEYYTRASNIWTDTGITYTPNGQCLHITFQRITSTTGTGIIQLFGTGPGSAITVNFGTGDGNLAIDQLELFCGSTDVSPSNENNFYFNFLSAYNAWR